MGFFELLGTLLVLLLINLPGIIQAWNKRRRANMPSGETYTELELDDDLPPIVADYAPSADEFPAEDRLAAAESDHSSPARHKHSTGVPAARTNNEGTDTLLPGLTHVLSSPTDLRRAILLAEVLHRPEENWS